METIDLCTECVQVISNPICPNCFSKHVITWLRDKNLPLYKMNIIKKYIKQLVKEAEETPSNTRCIICNSKKVNFCTYCFTKNTTKIIQKGLGEGQVLEQFKGDFNAKIWRMPWV